MKGGVVIGKYSTLKLTISLKRFIVLTPQTFRMIAIFNWLKNNTLYFLTVYSCIMCYFMQCKLLYYLPVNMFYCKFKAIYWQLCIYSLQ